MGRWDDVSDYLWLIDKHDPSQSRWELNQLLLALKRIEIETVLEIGVHRGGSLRLWRSAFLPSLCVGINWTDEYEGDIGDLVLITGRPSQDPETLDRVQSALSEKSVDFLFIDGGHSYEEVSQDWTNYSGLVRSGGVVALHDVVIEAGVWKFWLWLEARHRTSLFYEGDGAPGTGTGMVWL